MHNLDSIPNEETLAALAYCLGAATVPGLSKAEKGLASSITLDRRLVTAARFRIQYGSDPLGDAFCSLRSADKRREIGAVYTPHPLVNSMGAWAETVAQPDRVVDPGSGSGRFLVEAGRRFEAAKLVGVEIDPLAALIARANLAVLGMARRAEIRVEDFRASSLANFDGLTLYLGNPPYVRHHLIDTNWKAWLKREAEAMGLPASGLAGLHVYFFLTVARRARAGDFGALVTAAEWLDVNYGQLVRELFLDRLGGQGIYVVDSKAQPFPGTLTTAAITTFRIETRASSARFARVGSLASLRSLTSGKRVRRERLMSESRWSHFTRVRPEIPSGYTELGELCRVHRGQVTGSNRVWIEGPHSEHLPKSVMIPAVTRAVELFRAGAELVSLEALRRVICLPADLSIFSRSQLQVVEGFLKRAEQMGAHSTYTATHRRAWWSVDLRAPAAILATYMARQAPAFVLNTAGARHLNVAHGLYPREGMNRELLDKLVIYLRNSTSLSGGRVYAGGLTKFEPREMERIPVPEPSLLWEMAL